ncbi:MCP four helix bundle domain-containing protein, partial [Planomonospora parontospora]|uniref:MCP four helix bundle domain-containing protein n=1 Tax=Planomonospora parontospora TaxID=58119 RepID=UPI001EF65795
MAIVAVMGAGVSVVALSRMSALNDDLNTIKQGSVERLAHLVDLRGQMANMFNATTGVVSIPDPAMKAEAAAQMQKATEAVTAAFEAYKADATDSPALKENAASFAEAWQEYRTLRDTVMSAPAAAPAAGAGATAEIKAVVEQFTSVSDQLNTAMDNLAKLEKENAEGVTAAAADQYDGSRNLIMVLVAVGLLLAFGTARLVSGLIVRPLAEVSRVLDATAKGDLTGRVEV